MMLDMLAAVARKEYEDRRRRQAQGIAKAKADAVYRGRPEKIARYEGIAGMLRGVLDRYSGRRGLLARDDREGCAPGRGRRLGPRH
jgi:DNA invertase Pin-like site-specific DNA recombinase